MVLSARSTRLVAWLALACHLLVASGLPLPLAPPLGGTVTRQAGKDRSRPFPCMDKPCGCATAEQCFANCCCHTPAERLAWARAHRVEAAVLAALERRVAGAAAPAAGCCAAARAEPSCCTAADAEHPGGENREVCSDYRSLAADAEPAAEADRTETPRPPRAVILRDMLACGGILTAWLACGVAVPPPPRVATPAVLAATGVITVGDDVAHSPFADRSVPPPRVS